jgi:hypothetical protein
MTSQVFEPKQALQAIYDCIDGASSLLAWFLEDQDPNKIPPVWTEFEFGDLKIFGQYNSYNDDLERQADQLLRTAASASETGEIRLLEEGLVKSTSINADNEEEAIFDAIVQDLLDQLKH